TLDVGGHLGGDLPGQLEVLRPQAPRAVDAGALGDEGDLRAGQLEEVAAAQADVLRPQVAGGVVGGALGHGAGELGVEAGAARGLVVPVHPHQVFARVVRVRRDELGVGAAHVVDVVLL